MSIIYEPKGRAREYAALACNVYNGCDHRCRYCYAKRLGSHANPKTRVGLLDGLIEEIGAPNTLRGKMVHLCFTCDPYQTFDVRIGDTRRVIYMIHAAGGGVAILTKGGSRALRDIDLMTNKDAHAATLTFLDDEKSKEWEPGAALPSDRIQTLRIFNNAGIKTWVSLEPVLEPETSIEIIKMVHGFVDIFKIGKLNHSELADTIDWRKFGIDACTWLTRLGFARSFDPDKLQKGQYYIKKDLAAYLS
jgi:DNA repair photolyase